MKRFFLFFFASVLSISMFAQDPEQPTGKTKGQAIPYAWGEGIKVTANAGEGKWYKVDLYGKFNPATGKSAEGNADANIIVANPLDEKATVDVTAYVGDNETSRHFTLQAGEFKTMNIGAGMLVRMGIQYVYMFIVMDVTITPAQAEKIEVVVEDAPSNSTPFIPVDFVWGDNWASTHVAEGNNVAANKETWIMIDRSNKLTNGWTFKLYAQNLGSAATTIYGGLATDCPATNIQEQEKAVAANGIMSKELDLAMLDMMPDTIYVRLKANQPLKVWAEEVEPTLPDQPLFTVTGATEVEKNHAYKLSDSILYKVNYATLTAPEYYVTKVEIKNNGGSAVELTGKVVKNAGDNDEIYSAIKRTTTLQPGQKLTKEIDNTLLGNLEDGDHVHALVLGGNDDVEFKLIEVCTEKDTCDVKDGEAMVISASEISQPQAANTTKWYKVNIAAAKTANADILMTMEANEAAELTVDIAADCKLGEPVQSYTGSGKTTTKTLSNSLFKSAGDVIYVRVHTDKAITVKAKMLTSIVWNGTVWEGGIAPDIDHAARIEGNMTIGTELTDDFAELKALGLTLKDENIKITIKNGGKLIVGEEGIKGSENINQIIIEEGGQLLISPEAGSNNKPFITAKKNINLGVQEAVGHTLPELHDFIALPIENREAGVGQAMYYANWDRMAGWVANDNFRRSFVGYNVFIPAGASCPAAGPVPVEFKGQLAANKNQTLSMPANGWYAFGNSWTAAIPLSGIYSQLAGNDDAAVHFYVATPTDYSSQTENVLGLIKDNYYIPATSQIASQLGISEIKPMQGFFLHTNSSYSISLDYNALYEAKKAAAPKRVAADNSNMVAAVLSDGEGCDFVYMIEGEAGNAHKMIGNDIAIYAEDGLAQIANDNMIGTILTIQTNEKTEYTLHFGWLKGETMYLKDLENGNVIAMTAGNTYTFTAQPNTVSARFQVVGRNNVPTGMENNAAIEGANKRIENGRVVIIKNGVKYDVLGAQL